MFKVKQADEHTDKQEIPHALGEMLAFLVLTLEKVKVGSL